MKKISNVVQPPCCGCDKKYPSDDKEYDDGAHLSIRHLSIGKNMRPIKDTDLYILCPECFIKIEKILKEFKG